MNNPYAGIDWRTVIRAPSATHMHIHDQRELDHAYRFGIRHFPISNYYPSAPYRADTRPSDFKLRQWWPAQHRDKTLSPPIDWNRVITWRDELEEPYRSMLPFAEGDPAFERIPADSILSSNAEHHGFTNTGCHFCCPGSSLICGNFDAKGHFHLYKHGFATGFGGPWQDAFAALLENLDHPDGGGITINHPTWMSQCSDELVVQMLDFDPRVLGIEIYNAHDARKNWFKEPSYHAPAEPEAGYSLNMWDRILSSGRRCWGFCVPDHDVQHTAKVGENWNGRNVLLVPRFTEAECLHAYRRGCFYGCLKDNGLTVRELSVTDAAITIRTNAPSRISFITGAGSVHTVTGDGATFPLADHGIARRLRYVRVEIEDDTGERLFLQPIMIGAV